MRLPSLLVNSTEATRTSRIKLVASLYLQLRSYIEGTLGQVICVTICWFRTGWNGYAVLLCTVLAVFGLRLRQRARFLSRERRPADASREPEYWAGRYVWGSAATGLLWGATTMLAYLNSADVPLVMLILLIQAGWLGVGCVRNAASPAVVLVQTLTTLPLGILSLFLSHSGFLHLVGLFGFLQFSTNMTVSRYMGKQLSSLLASEGRLEAANLRLELLSATDGLTGIGNRRAFDMNLQIEWSRAMREQTPLAVLLVDVDFFKAYNDRNGHLVGDQCLRTLAQILEMGLRRPPDFAGRFGGEEFVCLLPGTSEAGAVDVAERLLKKIADAGIPHEASSSGFLSVSIGAASLIPQEGEQAAELVERADKALYRSKAAGRNRVTAPDPSPRQAADNQTLPAMSWMTASI